MSALRYAPPPIDCSLFFGLCLARSNRVGIDILAVGLQHFKRLQHRHWSLRQFYMPACHLCTIDSRAVRLYQTKEYHFRDVDETLRYAVLWRQRHVHVPSRCLSKWTLFYRLWTWVCPFGEADGPCPAWTHEIPAKIAWWNCSFASSDLNACVSLRGLCLQPSLSSDRLIWRRISDSGGLHAALVHHSHKSLHYYSRSHFDDKVKWKLRSHPEDWFLSWHDHVVQKLTIVKHFLARWYQSQKQLCDLSLCGSQHKIKETLWISYGDCHTYTVWYIILWYIRIWGLIFYHIWYDTVSRIHHIII